MDNLIKIQTELKAPKSQYNSFAKFKYRNCEDILEALKPLLSKYQSSVKISDSIELIGDRFYVKATAIFKSGEFTEEVSAFAREEETKKGMDASQITGATSSYARKYALNGLFLIDDTKDADSHETPLEAKKEVFLKPKKVSDEQLELSKAKIAMMKKANEAGLTQENIREMVLEMFKVEKIETLEQVKQIELELGKI